MRKFYCSILFVFLSYVAFATEITSIQGSVNICPTITTNYTVKYELKYSQPLTVYDQVTRVKWEFLQNGIVIKTLNSANFTAIGPTGSANISVSGLPYGAIKIKVTVYYTFRTPYSPPATLDMQKTKDIFVGIPSPISINGDVICPNSSGNFSTALLDNASSYTWEVPIGWTVNGITGPVVINQGNSVIIKPCSDTLCAPKPLSTYTIKVKGVSAACGTSTYMSKSIRIDYMIDITETNYSNDYVKLSASPTNFPNYQWSLDPIWSVPASVNRSSPEVSFNSKGITGLAKLTYKTSCQNIYTRDWWWIKPAQPGDPGWPEDPGNPGTPDPCDSEIPVYLKTSKYGNVVYLRDPCGEELPSATLYEYGSLKHIALTKSNEGYEFDISSLKGGAYILHIKTASGKYKTAKFIRMN